MYRLLGTHVAPVPYWDSLDACTHTGAGCDRAVITDLGAALDIDGPDILAVTSGYIGYIAGMGAAPQG